jgi:hypothetical protein
VLQLTLVNCTTDVYQLHCDNCCFNISSICPNEKENWKILTSKEIYAMVKKTTIAEKLRLNRLRWFGHVQRMEENRIPQKSIIRI